MCKVTIRNLENEIKNLSESTLRHKDMLDDFTASEKRQQRKMKRHDTYSKNYEVTNTCSVSPLHGN
jgi:hypothetical protein